MPHTGTKLGATIACEAVCAVGLALNLLWCTLIGHTPGFMLSSLSLARS